MHGTGLHISWGSGLFWSSHSQETTGKQENSELREREFWPAFFLTFGPTEDSTELSPVIPAGPGWPLEVKPVQLPSMAS